MIPGFVKSYEASAVITGRRIVMFSDTAASSKVAMAAANTSPMIGIADTMGAPAIGDLCDVHLSGLVSVELGGTVTAGAPLTSDATGRAIVAAVAATASRRVVAFAMEPGVVGDVIDVWLSQAPLFNA